MNDVTDSLAQALDRIEDFRSIHEPEGVTMEAVLCLQESVGISESTRRLVGERIFEREEAAGQSPANFLGVIIGLLAASFEAERRAPSGSTGSD